MSVGCVRPEHGDGAGGNGGEAGRAFEGNGIGVMGREGADGIEQEASMAAHEAEGSDEDEAMAGKENVSMQRAAGGSGSTGGIRKKRPPRKRAKGEKSQQQRQDAARPGWAREA